jgi:hypothetical protein
MLNNLFMINMATGNTRVDDAIDNKCNKNNLLNKFNLSIKETDKIGLDQLQEPICQK